jgi:hypothetical protein|tara:strand:+ start:1155 stop:2963 length:1809 start_codon:yes stop_codon:yes gene_type:complete
MAQDINIKYTDKNFSSLRGQLVELAKNYFPDAYNDFSPTSPGMMFMEMSAYVGDILSFYQDSQLQETFLQYAKDPSNLYSMAYMMGYKPKLTSASTVNIELTQRVAATTAGTSYLPNFNQALTIGANTVITAGTENFVLNSSVDFNFSSSYDDTLTTIYSVDSSGNPTEYELRKIAQASSGEIITKSFSIGSASKFLTLSVDDQSIIGILDITDGDGNKWTEVPYLGQDTVFTEAINSGTNSNKVPYLLTAVRTPNRFVTRFTSTGKLQIQFGSGMSTSSDTAFLPNPTNVGSGTNQGIRRADHAFDPSNFMFSSAYGNSPSNTTLTVRYIKGGGINSNIGANTITGFTASSLTATDTTYQNTLSITNPEPAAGGKDKDTIDEIRQNSLRSFNEQGRIVTKQDYAFRAMTMPSKFGAIAKTSVATDIEVPTANDNTYNPLGVCLYVLAYDNNKNLVQATPELKTNLKKYIAEFKSLTDGCTIKDAFIINIGVKFDIITLPSFNSREVILKCTQAIQDHFNVDKWAINQPINLSTVYTLLDRIKGVQTVQDVRIESKVNGNYSVYDYDIKGATMNNVVYPSLDPMIFEVKYPNNDIQGRVTTL